MSLNKRFVQYYAKASGLAVAKILIIYFFYKLGEFLQTHFILKHPWGILLGLFVGFSLGLGMIIYIAYKK